jgi:hypothetical protein
MVQIYSMDVKAFAGGQVDCKALLFSQGALLSLLELSLPLTLGMEPCKGSE